MRPAEGQLHAVASSDLAIAGVAVHLQHPDEAGKVGHWPLALAIGRIDICYRRRVRSAPGPIVPRIGPELTGLGPAAPWIERWRCRLVSGVSTAPSILAASERV